MRRLAALLALFALVPSRRAETQMDPAAPLSTVGTLVVAHGGGPDWNAQVEEVARLVQLPGPVGVSFLMGPGAASARFQDVAADLVRRGARQIVVVPMLVASHSGHYEQLRWLVGATDSLDEVMAHHLHESGIERAATTVPIRLAPALDDAPELADALADRALALGVAPASRALYLVGHGPNSAEDHAFWMANLRTVAERVRVLTGFRLVMTGLVRDDAPAPVRAEAVAQVRESIALLRDVTGQDVAVVPVLIGTGRVSRETLPRDLAGLPIVYGETGLLPHPAMTRWIESRVREAAERGLAERASD